jgi:hypothetical protein
MFVVDWLFGRRPMAVPGRSDDERLLPSIPPCLDLRFDKFPDEFLVCSRKSLFCLRSKCGTVWFRFRDMLSLSMLG